MPGGGPIALGHQRERLGDTEVDEFGQAIVANQHVVRLQVAVQHQIGVRVLHGFAYAQEHLDPPARVELARIAPAGDRQAADQLHRQIRRTIRGFADVEQAGYGRMLEGSDDLALAQETLAPVGIEQRILDDLEGDLLADLAIGAFGTVDHAHAALPQRFAQHVGTDAIADGDTAHIDGRQGDMADALPLRGRIGMMGGIGRKQGREHLRQPGVLDFDGPQQLGLACGIQFDGAIEQRAQSLPLRRVDVLVHALSECRGEGAGTYPSES